MTVWIAVTGGMPPGIPGFHVVTRSGGINPAGLILPGTETTTVAVVNFDGYATLEDVTVKLPGAPGATYRPVLRSIVPPPADTDQVTAFDTPTVGPMTFARKLFFPRTATDADWGRTGTAMSCGAGIVAGPDR